ncbi:MAG: chemotaxis protein CheA [Clostridium sp.]|jgi:two-component system chemotaxis sensor kinase CheA|nr:chemotaxis protein CheA [Clostridium sp.]
MDMSQYLEIFIDESKEHLQLLNQSLLSLEQDPQDRAVLDEIFRVAHTLKGMSGTMGFSKMAKLTHDMENVLHAIRNSEVKINSELLDLLFKCLDALENYTENIVNTGSEGDNNYNELINNLNMVLDKKKAGKEEKTPPLKDEHEKEKTPGESEYKTANFILDEFEQNAVNKAYAIGMNVFEITVVLNKSCLLKSARAFIIFQTLEKYGEIIKSEPRVEDIEDEKFDFEFTVVCVTREEASVFAKEINQISEVKKVVIKPIDSGKFNQSQLEEDEDEILTKGNNIQDDEKDSQNADDQSKLKMKSHKTKTGKTVRVDIDRLDVLMNLVSELIIIKTRLEGIEDVDTSKNYAEAVEYLERITTSLHDSVMKVRMVPVDLVFNRFPRMIRDVSRELGKDIVLNMTGTETELDRTVIDEIGEPLIHLIRNSADHGIESKEIREKIGKPPSGHINLKAYQVGNNVVIEVEDDGQGIDLDKVKEKAIEKGVLKKDMANNLSQKDIIDLLFKPSFTTSDKITDLSGRGVGLDVVKTKIEQLGGAVEVETEKGVGSKFIIRLPLTLAIIQALLVVIGDEKYAIPLNSTKEIIKITPEQIKMIQNQEVILLRNMVVPIVRLNKILEVPEYDEDKKNLTVVIVKKGEKTSGFLVDSLIGQREVVIKSLGKLLSGVKHIAGATILGDGNVALILDVNSLAV